MEYKKTVEFNEVAYVGWCNNRLILRPKYSIDGKEFSDTLFIFCGKFKTYELCHLTRAILKAEIREADYERVRNLIMDGINSWCRNLGLSLVSEKI